MFTVSCLFFCKITGPSNKNFVRTVEAVLFWTRNCGEDFSLSGFQTFVGSSESQPRVFKRATTRGLGCITRISTHFVPSGQEKRRKRLGLNRSVQGCNTNQISRAGAAPGAAWLKSASVRPSSSCFTREARRLHVQRDGLPVSVLRNVSANTSELDFCQCSLRLQQPNRTQSQVSFG